MTFSPRREARLSASVGWSSSSCMGFSVLYAAYLGSDGASCDSTSFLEYDYDVAIRSPRFQDPVVISRSPHVLFEIMTLDKKVGLGAGVELARGLFGPVSPNRPTADSPPGRCLRFSRAKSLINVGGGGGD